MLEHCRTQKAYHKKLRKSTLKAQNKSGRISLLGNPPAQSQKSSHAISSGFQINYSKYQRISAPQQQGARQTYGNMCRKQNRFVLPYCRSLHCPS